MEAHVKKYFVYVGLAAAAALVFGGGSTLLAGAGATAEDGQKFEARLTGAEEVPAVVTDTTGKVEVIFSADETSASYELEVRKGVRVTQSHIHCGAAGVNGPVVVFLAGFHDRGWDVDGSWIENATVTNANVIARPVSAACPFAINTLADVARAAREGLAYVNVHTIAHPGGEVRGQLEADDDER